MDLALYESRDRYYARAAHDLGAPAIFLPSCRRRPALRRLLNCIS